MHQPSGLLGQACILWWGGMAVGNFRISTCTSKFTTIVSDICAFCQKSSEGDEEDVEQSSLHDKAEGSL